MFIIYQRGDSKFVSHPKEVVGVVKGTPRDAQSIVDVLNQIDSSEGYFCEDVSEINLTNIDSFLD